MPNKQPSMIKTSYSTCLSMCPGKCLYCKKLRHILLNLELNYSVKIYPKFINLYTFGKEILWSFQIWYKKIHYVTHIVTWKHNVKDGSKKKNTIYLFILQLSMFIINLQAFYTSNKKVLDLIFLLHKMPISYHKNYGHEVVLKKRLSVQ